MRRANDIGIGLAIAKARGTWRGAWDSRFVVVHHPRGFELVQRGIPVEDSPDLEDTRVAFGIAVARRGGCDSIYTGKDYLSPELEANATGVTPDGMRWFTGRVVLDPRRWTRSPGKPASADSRGLCSAPTHHDDCERGLDGIDP